MFSATWAFGLFGRSNNRKVIGATLACVTAKMHSIDFWEKRDTTHIGTRGVDEDVFFFAKMFP